MADLATGSELAPLRGKWHACHLTLLFLPVGCGSLQVLPWAQPLCCLPGSPHLSSPAAPLALAGGPQVAELGTS